MNIINIRLIHEYNSDGHLLYIENFPGAYVRSPSKEDAFSKLTTEIKNYCLWADIPCDLTDISYTIVQDKLSTLQICDADSDVIFESEKKPLTAEEYSTLKKLTLKSAEDFHSLYMSVPDKAGTCLSPRKTFYGFVPITAEEMYLHTKNVNSYYFGEIGVDACNEPDIFTCRNEALSILESSSDYLLNAVHNGSYGEQWSLRKLFRRFIWHDRIHARAMYRMSVRLCGKNNVQNPFFFEI